MLAAGAETEEAIRFAAEDSGCAFFEWMDGWICVYVCIISVRGLVVAMVMGLTETVTFYLPFVWVQTGT